MTPSKSIAQSGNTKADTELLFKGILCALIGLGVLISPMFMASSPFSATVASASLIGWFSLVLGCALTALYARRRLAAARRASPSIR